MTLKELAEIACMTPDELREWFPGMFDPNTADNETVEQELVSDVLKELGHLDTYPY